MSEYTISKKAKELLENTSQMLDYFATTYKMIPISKLSAFDKDQIIGQDMEFTSWINELEIIGNVLLANSPTDTITIDRAEIAELVEALEVARDDVVSQLDQYAILLPHKQHRYDAQKEMLDKIDALIAKHRG